MDNGKTLYLYFTHYSKGSLPSGYSLYSVDISLPSGDKGCEVKQPQLVVYFPLTRRHHMACAKLGSKFYFLGGLTPPYENKNAHYPSDDMVYDPTDPDNSDKEPVYRVTQVKPMNFGKGNPSRWK